MAESAQQTVSIDTSPQEQELPPVSIDTGNMSPPLSPGIAAMRASKASFGLVDLTTKKYDDIYQGLVNGRERSLRDEIASELIERSNSKLRQVLIKNPDIPQSDVLSYIANRPPLDPKSVFEEAFSRKYMNALEDHSTEASAITEALRILPDETKRIKKLGEYVSNQRQIAQTMLEDIENRISGQSWAGWGWDEAKMMMGPYREAIAGHLLMGTGLEAEAMDILNSGSLEEYKKRLSARVEELDAHNHQLAKEFLSAVIGRSTSDIRLDNLFSAIDISTIPGAVKGGALLAKRALIWNGTRSAYKDLVKSVENSGKVPPDVAAADGAGNLGEAAVKKASVDALKEMEGKPQSPNEVVEELQSAWKVTEEAFGKNPGNFGQEIVNRLKESSEGVRQLFFEALRQAMRVERIPAARASENIQRLLKESIKDQYPGHSNTVLNIDLGHEPITNTYHAIIDLGRNDGELFEGESLARRSAVMRGLRNVEVRRKGDKWYIRATKPIREDSDLMREALLLTKDDRSPDSWGEIYHGWLTNWIRTPEETLSKEQRMQRKIATYAPSILMKIAKDNSKDIARLARWSFVPGTKRKERWSEWKRTIDQARFIQDPVTKKPGYFFETPGALEDYYWRTWKRHPEAQEIAAYFAHVRNAEMDRTLRNIAIYRNISRWGGQQHRFFTLAGGASKTGIKYSPWVNGRQIFEVPGGTDTALVMGDVVGKERLMAATGLSRNKELAEKLKKGEIKIFEVWNTEERPFSGWSESVGQAKVRYVVTKNLETQPLPYDLLPKRGGGHFEYDYDHYVKQAKIRREQIGKSIKHHYEGDTTVLPVSIRAMGVDVAKHLNKIREFLKEEKPEEALEYFKHNMPGEVSWDDVHGWFKPSEDAKGVKRPPRLDLNEPFYVVPRDKTILDVDNTLKNRYPDTFHDGTTSGNPARQYQVAYTGERDAYEIYSLVDKGSRRNPLYSFEPAKLVDPITTANRALAKIINSTWLDDYKIQAIEHWVSEAAPYLKVKDPAEIRYSPFHFFYQAMDKNAWVKGANPQDATKIARLQANHQKIRQFTGIQSTTDTFLNRAAQHLIDSIYTRFGPGWFNYAPEWILPTIKDPFRFVRSVVFNAKMGLFSIPQFMVHAMTYVNVMGIAGPKNAGVGALGALLHGWSHLNKHPEILKHMDGLAVKMGLFKPGEWQEAYELAGRSGFFNEAGTYALRDDLLSSKVVSYGTHAFLDAGQMFFRGGVKSLRAGSWYTAYKEYRLLKPTGRIDDAALRSILERADILSHNMTRASNSMLHTGILSLPAQFYTYFLRLAELMIGKRLTLLEKTRLFAVNAAIFGIPAASGIVGYPFGDHMRNAAKELRYEVGDKFWQSLMMEGLPSAMGAIITGSGDPKSGTWYDWGERYGPGKGLFNVGAGISGDKTILDIFGGATYSTLSNAWQQGDGLRTWIMSMFNNDGKVIPLKADDFISPLREASSFNYLIGALSTLHTGKYFSKNGTYVGPSSPMNAIFRGLTGLADQREVNLWELGQALQSQEKNYKYTEKQFRKAMQKGMRDFADNNPESGREWFTKALAELERGAYPAEMRSKLWSQLLTDNQSLLERIPHEWALRHVPAGQEQKRQEQFKRYLGTGGGM
jgi:hypothetical protein